MPASSPIVSWQRSRARWPGYAAALWALAFAAYSFYGALGGDLGVDQLARDIREDAEVRDPGFVAELWVAGALKVVAASLAIALAIRLGYAPRNRALLIAGWLLAGGLLIYGAANIVQFGLMKVGAISTPDSVAPMPWTGTCFSGNRSGCSAASRSRPRPGPTAGIRRPDSSDGI
jgi:ABC-type Fe3+ transport system permease subunit